MADNTFDRITGMTEHEAVHALCTLRITPDELYAVWGYYPRTDSVVGEYEKYKRHCENTDLYWDEKIANLREQIVELESNKEAGILPRVPYSF